MPPRDPHPGEIWLHTENPASRSCVVILTRDERALCIGRYIGHGVKLTRSFFFREEGFEGFLRAYIYVPLLPGMPREVINFLDALASELPSWTLQTLCDREPTFDPGPPQPPRDMWDHLLED